MQSLQQLPMRPAAPLPAALLAAGLVLLLPLQWAARLVCHSFAAALTGSVHTSSAPVGSGQPEDIAACGTCRKGHNKAAADETN